LEFVTVSLLLVTVLVCIVNLGIAYRNKVAVIAAAREAARTAVVLHDNGVSLGDARLKGKLRGEEMLEFAFDAFQDPVVTVDQSGGFMTATARATMPLVFPGFGYLLGSDHPRIIELTGKASYRLGEGRV